MTRRKALRATPRDTTVGTLGTASGGRLEIGLCDHGQGQKVYVRKLSKGGYVSQSLSVDPTEAEALATLMATAAGIAALADFREARTAMHNDTARRSQ